MDPVGIPTKSMDAAGLPPPFAGQVCQLMITFGGDPHEREREEAADAVGSPTLPIGSSRDSRDML